MSESKKPRIAEILEVEVGERFSVEGQRSGDPLYVDRDGWVRYVSDDNPSLSAVTIAINHPDRIIRKPRWTEQDKEDARKIKVIFPDDYCLDVGRLDDGRLKLVIIQGLSFALINDELLPSLKPGERATLDEIIGGGE